MLITRMQAMGDLMQTTSDVTVHVPRLTSHSTALLCHGYCVKLQELVMLMFAARLNARVHWADRLSEQTTYCINGGSTSSEVAIHEALVAQRLGHDGAINAAYHAKA